VRTISLFILLSVSINAYSENWGWKSYVRDDQSASILETKDGTYSLSEAIASVHQDVWLKYFRVFASNRHPEFQREIHEYLALNYPIEHQEALASAGNMHNPKVTALRDAFEEAILASSLVGAINSDLEQRCERITSVSYEKFMISGGEEQPEYLALIWLSTDKCT
jgi:hypothetical protein